VSADTRRPDLPSCLYSMPSLSQPVGRDQPAALGWHLESVIGADVSRAGWEA
jgi:hypothetical protein